MALKTRLDPRSRDNGSFQLVHAKTGTILADVVLLDSIGNVQISTVNEIYIRKPNGWCSGKKVADVKTD